ncbi:MAG TPA: tetratricopeptide repeat protein, partial [Ignavibacteriaceae bacterium]
AISIWDSTLSSDNPLLANCYSNLSDVYFQNGEYPRAIEYDEKALTIWQEKLGEGHPYIASSFNNLAEKYISNGDFNKALECDFKAVQIRKDLGGEETREVAYSYALIAGIFMKMNNLNNCEYFLNKSIGIYKKVDPSNPDLSDAYTSAGNLHRIKSEYKTAEAYYDSALHTAWPDYDSSNIKMIDPVNITSARQFINALIERG